MTSHGPPERVFVVGYYGFDNLGDEAIRMAIERAAPRNGATIVHFATRGPSDDPRAVPVRGLGLWRYVRAIWRVDRVVLGGGGILKDEGLWLPAELFLTAALARLARRRVTLLAVGVGPFYRSLGRALIAATARLATLRTVRDETSGEALLQLGIRDWVLGADPVFTLAGHPSAASARGPESGHLDDSRSRRAVVAIRPWFLGDDAANEPRRQTFRRAVGEAVGALERGGWAIDIAALHWPRDRDESRRLADEAGLIEPGSGVRLVDRRLDWDGLVELVRDADLVVAMRYHALVAAAVTGRPAVALAYEPKVSALAAELGIPMLAVDAPDLAGRLVQAVSSAVDGFAAAPHPAAVAALCARAEAALGLALSGGREGLPD